VIEMTAMPSGVLAPSLRPKPVEAPPAPPPGLRNDLFSNGRLFLDQVDPLVAARYLIAFLIGVAATVAWQSYDNPAGQANTLTANSSDRQLNAILLDTVRRSVDRVNTGISTGQEQISRNVDKLVASQEQMTREINKLQAVVLYKNAEPLPRSASAPALNQALRPSQAPVEADARSDWRRQPCCQWPVSSTR
jgi:hypothetical protein